MTIPLNDVKTLVFDLDDTLVVEEASAEAALLQTCELARTRRGVEPRDLYASVRRTCRALWHRAPVRAYCVDIGVSSWEALWARFEGEDENLRILRDWAPHYRRDSWLDALAEHGINDRELALELAETFPARRRKLHVIYDDVHPALAHFRGRFRLGLLTNGASDLQREKIAGAGIGDYFDEVVVSGDLGFGKPDPRIFRVILSRLGAVAEEAIMLGNSLHSDIRGAQAIGMRTVWVNRSGAARENGIIPDCEISNLGGLIGLMG